MTPQRIQRKRTKGWRMPEGAVYVGRGTKWGNPYRVGDESAFIGENPVMGLDEPLSQEDAAQLYGIALRGGHLQITAATASTELAGKDLACWCKPGDPCHADILLEIANQTPPVGSAETTVGEPPAAAAMEPMPSGAEPQVSLASGASVAGCAGEEV